MTDWTPPSILGDEGDISYLLELVWRRPAWYEKAACRGMGADIFYSEDHVDQREAQAVCVRCDVRAECAEAGRRERHGRWGGLSERQRKTRRRVA